MMEDFSENTEAAIISGSADFHSQKQFQSSPSINYGAFPIDLVSTFGDLTPRTSVLPPITEVDNFIMREESVRGIAPCANTNLDLIGGDTATSFCKSPFGCNTSIQQCDGNSTAGTYQAPPLRSSICFENTNNSNGISLNYTLNQNIPNTMYHQPMVPTQYSGGAIEGSHIYRTPQLGPQAQMRQVYLEKAKQSPDRRRKAAKKRKKKGIDEPQRPVSAYALFFRDTQAAIKTDNSSATFGEISKLVASMWDNLSEQAKQVYKQKTENAKREYLKHLAAFRANMISKEISSASRLVCPASSQAEMYVMENKGAQPSQPAPTILSTSMTGFRSAPSLNVSIQNSVPEETPHKPLFMSALMNMPMAHVSTSSTTQLQNTSSESLFLTGICQREMAPSATLPGMNDRGVNDIHMMSGQQSNSVHVNSLIQGFESAGDSSRPVAPAQESTSRFCMRPGCNSLPMQGPYADDVYCSPECAYGHANCR